MKVTLLYFAAARERVGRSSETLYLLEGATAGDALEAACVGHPELRPLAGKLRLAVDQTFSPPTAPLKDGCEVALIPPVSGGSSGDDGGGRAGGLGA
jgi:molybdopterin synthase catalytic subunit